MKFNKTLQLYYNKRIDAIITALKANDDAFTADTFHEIRVEIKKLRAFFDLLNASAADFPEKKYSRPFAKLFRQLGTIREMQLEQEWLSARKTKTAIAAYIRHVDKEIAGEIGQFLQMKDKSRKQIKAVANKAFAYVKAVKKKKAFGWLKKKGEKIDDIISSNVDVAGVHKLRKNLKGYVYMLHTLKQEEEASHKKLDDFQDLLGKWHDNRVMSDHLVAIPADVRLSKSTKENLTALSKTLNNTAEKQYRQIVVTLPYVMNDDNQTK